MVKLLPGFLTCLPIVYNLDIYNLIFITSFSVSCSTTPLYFFIWVWKIQLKNDPWSINIYKQHCTENEVFLQIWSHLLKKPLMENFTFCAAQIACGCFKMLWDFRWITQILLLLTFVEASQLPKHPGDHYNPKKLGIHFTPETIIFSIDFSNFDHFIIFLPVLFL